MRRFRTILFLLLSIAVPLQGYAHFAQPAAHCPMAQAAMMDAAAGAAHDCCSDADPAGKTCKSGHACQSVGSVLPVAGLGDLPHDLAPSVRFPHLADIAFTFDPAATWRPPANSDSSYRVPHCVCLIGRQCGVLVPSRFVCHA